MKSTKCEPERADGCGFRPLSVPAGTSCPVRRTGHRALVSGVGVGRRSRGACGAEVKRYGRAGRGSDVGSASAGKTTGEKGMGKQQGRRTQCTAPLLWHSVPLRTLGIFERRFVRYGQLLAAFGTACGQHLPTVGGSHSLTETVLVDSLPARGLECSFHCHSSILFIL